MLKDFKDKIAVITGAASGLGLEIARVAASRGMHVVLVDINPYALDKAGKELTQEYDIELLKQETDVSNIEQVQALASTVKTHFGVPHLLFNNAGVESGGLVWEVGQIEWLKIVGVDLWGVINGIRTFVPQMLAMANHTPHYQGHIINTASLAGFVPLPLMGTHSAAKAAVVKLTESLYYDLSLTTQQLGVSLVCPDFITTEPIPDQEDFPSELEALTVSQQLARDIRHDLARQSTGTLFGLAAAVFDAIAHNEFYVFASQRDQHVLEAYWKGIHSHKHPIHSGFAPHVLAHLKKRLEAKYQL